MAASRREVARVRGVSPYLGRRLGDDVRSRDGSSRLAQYLRLESVSLPLDELAHWSVGPDDRARASTAWIAGWLGNDRPGRCSLCLRLKTMDAAGGHWHAATGDPAGLSWRSQSPDGRTPPGDVAWLFGPRVLRLGRRVSCGDL